MASSSDEQQTAYPSIEGHASCAPVLHYFVSISTLPDKFCVSKSITVSSYWYQDHHWTAADLCRLKVYTAQGDWWKELSLSKACCQCIYVTNNSGWSQHLSEKISTNACLREVTTTCTAFFWSDILGTPLLISNPVHVMMSCTRQTLMPNYEDS